ncbi:hypothetical protein ABXT08_15185 [Chryseobacterium sp. NRRL B-14859]|uniref:hypothetical protein n=1 Tax=Chryseobacterium sp. NRRL B-14859 TaxID=1562763 RepID=UPI0033962B00
MKNALKISSLALLAFVCFSSCSTESDIASETQQTALMKSSAGKNDPTEKLSTIKTTVLAESLKIDELLSPFNPNGRSSLVLNYGNVNLHLDLQSDYNLVLYASPINWSGPGYPNPAIWASNTVRSPYANNNSPYLSAQGDGNLVLYKDYPYNAANSIWATNTAVGNVSNPKFKLQIVQKKNGITGNSEYYGTFILEGNNSERHEIVVANITDAFNGFKS